MKFNIWTLLFQVINFLVLLFVLTRLLYKPIREVMEKRRGLIEKSVREAEELKKEAMTLKEKHDEELRKIKEIQVQMIDKMKAEIETERMRILSEAEKEADMVLEKEKALLDAEKTRQVTALKEQSLDAVSAFAHRLLGDIADEELHKATYRKFLDRIGDAARGIKAVQDDEVVSVDLVTAYALQEEELSQLRLALESSLSKRVIFETAIDKALLAGIRMKAYDVVLDGSLSGQIDALKLRLKETM